MEELMRTLKQGSGTKQVLECHCFVIVIDINNCEDDHHHHDRYSLSIVISVISILSPILTIIITTIIIIHNPPAYHSFHIINIDRFLSGTQS